MAIGNPLNNPHIQNNKINVYIDDIDRGWEASKSDITVVSALLNALRDICGSQSNLKCCLSLRSDVYFLVRTSDESTDKIEQYLIWLTWTNHDILVIMAKRATSFQGKHISDQELRRMSQIGASQFMFFFIEETYRDRGKWEKAPIHRVLLSLTRRRPRDLVKLLSGAANSAHRDGRSLINTSDLKNMFPSYSNERLQDIINEFKTELPNVKALILNMKPNKRTRYTLDQFSFTNDKLFEKLNNVKSSNSFRFSDGRSVSSKSLAEFLYKVNFLIARKEIGGFIERVYYEDNRFLMNDVADFGFNWEIHPAYRWALQPDNVQSLIDEIRLENSDD